MAEPFVNQAEPPANLHRPNFDRLDSLGYLSFRLFRLFERALDHALASHGIAVAQFRVLLVLWEAGEVTQADIARHLDLEQPTIANTLARMRRDGLLETTPDPTDRRRTLIRPAPRAEEVRASVLAAAGDVNQRATSGLSDAERTEAARLLRGLIAGLEQAPS